MSDPFNYCLHCNPGENWLELEFMSENDEPIEGLVVTIQHNDATDSHTLTTVNGQVRFDKIIAGEWRVTVTQASLLSEVEKYAARKEGLTSPVQLRAVNEATPTGQHPKRYRSTTIGDFWDSAPDDAFLQQYHKGVDINASPDQPGLLLSHNKSYIFEIKALRSYLPVIIDTDKFSLVNSYTFALLAQLAYASDKFGIPDSKNPRLPEGGIESVIEQLKQRQRPQYCASTKEEWLLREVPYSQHLSYEFYKNSSIGCEGYMLSNADNVIIGVRGTQTYFGNEEIGRIANQASIQLAPQGNPAALMLAEGTDGVRALVQSPGYKDVTTDLDAAQVAVPELGNTYLHRGFYRYAAAFWKLIKDDIKDFHQGKTCYVCGHSLGGAGALIISALLRTSFSPDTLRLFTYGMPRTGTHSFVHGYNDLVHFRHVNNHDIVPQVPCKWMNTASKEKDESQLQQLAVKGFLRFMVGSLLERVTDDDDDNYHHHGNLVQLLTYSVAKHRPADVKQVLLTPRQTHITSLTFAADKQDDSYVLADSLRKEHIDINGYIGTIKDSGFDHMMSQYIPNLKSQLSMMFSNSLADSYQKAAAELSDIEARLTRSYYRIQHELIEAQKVSYHVGDARRMSLKYELDAAEKIILNIQQVKLELQQLNRDPNLLPLQSLLYGSRHYNTTKLKEQLQ